MGFIYFELLFINEYFFDGSWGYQLIGLYVLICCFGICDDFCYFIDVVYVVGLNVIFDWVLGYFLIDDFVFVEFDGMNLYEYSDLCEGYYQDWNMLIYNYGCCEVSNFFVGNVFYWIECFGIDVLCVDVVVLMIYCDYSCKEGEWILNEFGGCENFEVIEFLCNINCIFGEQVFGVVIMVEEFIDFFGVFCLQDMGGLGFWYKWNFGWMYDILDYMKFDLVYCQYYYDKLIFGIFYNYIENFVLLLLYDEVVYGKKLIFDCMLGDVWQKFVNLCVYYGWMWVFLGKKLLFMGNEFVQGCEWNYDVSFDWYLLEGGDNWYYGVQCLVCDLNFIYCYYKVMYELDFDLYGFEWLVVDDKECLVLIFVCCDKEGNEIIVVSNFMLVLCYDYCFGINQLGKWCEIFNIDFMYYYGSNVGNGGMVYSDEIVSYGCQYLLSLMLLLLVIIWLVWEVE